MDFGDAIEDFLVRHASALHWVLREAAGVWVREDLYPEAYCSLLELQSQIGRSLDLRSESDAADVLRHMRRRARRSGGGIHRIQRPDQAGDDDAPSVPGWDRFLFDEGEHPASLLEAWESAAPERPDLPAYHSPAAGWARLLRRFDNEFTSLAAFLLISPSWCYACFRNAKHLAVTQWPLPHPPMPDNEAEALQPWRSFKLPPRERDTASQHTFDFWQQPAQPDAGQLWLL